MLSPGGCVNIKDAVLPVYGFPFNYKEKTVLYPCYHYTGNLHSWKGVFFLYIWVPGLYIEMLPCCIFSGRGRDGRWHSAADYWRGGSAAGWRGQWWCQGVWRFNSIQNYCLIFVFVQDNFYTPAQLSWRGGGILDSPCPSVCPSVCRRHGFRSISQVCFGISISNFICMLMEAIGRSLFIFSDITFKIAAWRPYWILWFPDSNFTLALNINFKLQRHSTYVYG